MTATFKSNLREVMIVIDEFSNFHRKFGNSSHVQMTDDCLVELIVIQNELLISKECQENLTTFIGSLR